MRDTFALGGGPYHFFARSSRSAAASSICSASNFFSLAFSSSSCFRRLASETSMPPNFAFQLYSVASETPCFRARSAVFAPASCSRSTPIICSSVNLARFICPSFTRPDSNSTWRKLAGAGNAYAAPAGTLSHDNFKDFAGQDAETYRTSRVQAPDGKTRELYCVIRARPDGRELVIVHPADFISWIDRKFKISPEAIRQAFAVIPQP